MPMRRVPVSGLPWGRVTGGGDCSRYRSAAAVLMGGSDGCDRYPVAVAVSALCRLRKGMQCVTKMDLPCG